MSSLVLGQRAVVGGDCEVRGGRANLARMLTQGDKAPDFELESDAGKKVRLRDFRGQRVVVYFYPKDATPGCTVEAHDFSKAKKAFDALGVTVLGISRDSVKSHGSFRDKQSLTIPLLSDPDRVAHEGFGAWGEKTMYGKKILGAIRSTFLIGEDGKIVRAWPSVKVPGHVDAVLAAARGESEKPSAKKAPTTQAATQPAPKKAAVKKAAPVAKAPAESKAAKKS